MPRSPEARAAEAEATRIANDELRERLDELIALRTADLETSQAAQSQAAHATAEASRIEQTLAGALAELAVQVDDLAHRLDNPPARGQQEAIEAREGQEEAKALIRQASTIAETRRQGPRTQR